MHVLGIIFGNAPRTLSVIAAKINIGVQFGAIPSHLSDTDSDMPPAPGTDCPYPIRILAFFEMIRPYHVVIRI